MATVRLDERRIHTLKPRKSAYDIRDRELKGFGGVDPVSWTVMDLGERGVAGSVRS